MVRIRDRKRCVYCNMKNLKDIYFKKKKYSENSLKMKMNKLYATRSLFLTKKI